MTYGFLVIRGDTNHALATGKQRQDQPKFHSASIFGGDSETRTTTDGAQDPNGALF